MHTNLLNSITLLAAAAAKAPAKKSSSGSLLIYIIPLLLVAYLVILRPQRKRAQAQRGQQSTIVEGDTVSTIGGIVGKVISIDTERAILEVAPDMEMEFLRRAIASKVDPLLVDGAFGDADEDEEDADDAGAGHVDDEERGWHGYHPDDVDHETDDDEDVGGHPVAKAEPALAEAEPALAEAEPALAEAEPASAEVSGSNGRSPAPNGSTAPSEPAGQGHPKQDPADHDPADHDPADLGSVFGVPVASSDPGERSGE